MSQKEPSPDTPVAGSPAAGLPESYRRWRNSRLGQITDRLEERLILELLARLESVRVLDIGCGDGALGSVLARRGAHVTGLDADARMLAAARRRAQDDGIALALVRGEAEVLPFADATFDRIVAVTVLCFVEEADRAIGEMARVLKPGGKLVIGEFGRWSLWAAIRHLRGWLGAPTWKAARFRSAGELRRLLTAHGLPIEQTAGAIYYPPAGMAASLLARFDTWFARRTTVGAAFIALSAIKPAPASRGE